MRTASRRGRDTSPSAASNDDDAACAGIGARCIRTPSFAHVALSFIRSIGASSLIRCIRAPSFARCVAASMLYGAVAGLHGEPVQRELPADRPHAPTAIDASARGEALYAGRAPLNAVVRGQDFRLPAAVAACAQCHEHDARPRNGIGIPMLDRASLTEARARRGGPPSAYAMADFCRVLATSIDPAGVMLEKTMPQYRMDDADCAALWTHLTTRPR